jgi:hypothetical protein
MVTIVNISSYEAQDHRELENISNRHLERRATQLEALYMAVYTAPGVAVPPKYFSRGYPLGLCQGWHQTGHPPRGGGATAPFYPERGEIWCWSPPLGWQCQPSND